MGLQLGSKLQTHGCCQCRGRFGHRSLALETEHLVVLVLLFEDDWLVEVGVEHRVSRFGTSLVDDRLYGHELLREFVDHQPRIGDLAELVDAHGAAEDRKADPRRCGHDALEFFEGPLLEQREELASDTAAVPDAGFVVPGLGAPPAAEMPLAGPRIGLRIVLRGKSDRDGIKRVTAVPAPYLWSQRQLQELVAVHVDSTSCIL